ncbi:hypothetical protein PoB_007172500 [Plakobranchus ocellatus]|uniref:Uncharacterized protein n=1 Tax=Plakobranchus ocellatus TaxID=259542 RepID=A0AAV4DM38_9GAST|nr:hypothetical protein PoB_007172500 [Plakobranchus ocellatus]
MFCLTGSLRVGPDVLFHTCWSASSLLEAVMKADSYHHDATCLPYDSGSISGQIDDVEQNPSSFLSEGISYLAHCIHASIGLVIGQDNLRLSTLVSHLLETECTVLSKNTFFPFLPRIRHQR